MKFRSLFKVLLVLLLAAALVAACGPRETTEREQPTAEEDVSEPDAEPVVKDPEPEPGSGLTAEIGELIGEAEVRGSEEAAFTTAEVGTQIVQNGQVHTLDNSRARIDMPDGTVVRVGPDTFFTLTTVEESSEGLLTRLSLTAGKLWVVLSGGSLEVDTNAGVGAVRGSYMSVEYNPETGFYLLTCLEADPACEYSVGGETFVIPPGTIIRVPELGADPEFEDITVELILDWLENVPEAEDVVGEIGDFVWEDANGNGLQDGGEAGLEFAEVVLWRVGEEEDFMFNLFMTGPDGLYTFENVPMGEYYIEVIVPEGYDFTDKDVGEDDTIDSDVDVSGVSDPFAYAPGELKTDLDAGVLPLVGGGGGAGGAVCPLTGEAVDPAYLDMRPIGLSISHFPPKATRPPTGINWASWVYEIFIGEGQTRLFSIFYCGYPEVIGEKVDADDPAADLYPAVGNFTWYDFDGDGIQDDNEPGLPGVTVELKDVSQNVIASTITDEYGYYMFTNVEPGEYFVDFIPPYDYSFAPRYTGDDRTVDSDAGGFGLTDLFLVEEDTEYLDMFDAGFYVVTRIEGVRSGRVIYYDIIKYFGGGLIYAGADPRVEAVIGDAKCASAGSTDPNDIGSGGIDVTRLMDVAEECQTDYGNTDLEVYTFGPPPDGGEPAGNFLMFYNQQNQTQWIYDPALGGYVRYQNSIDEPDVFTMSTDRLSGDPVVRSNVIVLATQHTVQNPAGTIIDISLDYQQGTAYLFRDGMMYQVCWSTLNADYATDSTRLRPVLITDCYGNNIPLASGPSWVNVTDTNVWVHFEDGWWIARFYQPEYQAP